MLIDITYKLTPKSAKQSNENTSPDLIGHLGTHFDVMECEFPLEYTKRRGIVFDLSDIVDRDIEVSDIDADRIKKGDFVAFCTEYIEKVSYGTQTYFKDHPQLSFELIELLVAKGVSVIAIDCAGIRRGREHLPTDRYCAQKGTFVVENLCNLKALTEQDEFIAHTYPMSYEGITGLPCRVIAEIHK